MQRTKLSQTSLAPLVAILQAQSGLRFDLGPPQQPALYKRYCQIEQHAEEKNLPILYLFTAPYDPETQVFRGSQYDWVFLNYDRDPNYHHKAGFAIPEHVLNDLKSIQRARIVWNSLRIAHEIEKIADPALPLDASLLLPPAPREGLELSAQLGRIGVALQRWATRASLFSLATAAITTLPAAVALVSLDPILIGLIGEKEDKRLTPGEPAAYYALSVWRYNEI